MTYKSMPCSSAPRDVRSGRRSRGRQRMGQSLVATILIVVAALIVAPNALGASISIRPIAEGPFRDVASRITVDTTNIDTVARVGVRWKVVNISGVPQSCGPRFDQDNGESLGQTEQFDDLSPRSDVFPVTWTFRREMLVCAWIDPVFGGGPTLGATSAKVAVRDQPGSLVIGVTTPAPTVLYPVGLELSGFSTVRALYTFLKVRPADGRPCAVSFAADPGEEVRTPSDVLEGSFRQTSISFLPTSPATYLVCAWLTSLANLETGEYGGDPYPAAVAQATVAVKAQVPPVVTSPLIRSAKPTLTRPSVSGRTLRVTVRTKGAGVVTVRLVGKRKRVLLVRRTIRNYSGRNLALVYRRPNRLKPGAYVLEATYKAVGVSAVSKPTRLRVVFSR